MLIQFSLKNFKTFKEKATLSLVASNYDKKVREYENVVSIDQFDLLIVRLISLY